MKTVPKTHLLKALKAAAGACLAVWVAMLLGLMYATSAGIITLLSLQDTKKETLLMAFKRLLSFLAAVLIAYVSFSLLGYTLPALGLYLFLFVLLCHIFSLQNAIAMCSVLITHFWAEQNMGMPLIRNEILLLLIGAGIGIVLNLFLPRDIPAIRDGQRQIEAVMRRVLERIADIITGDTQREIPELGELSNSLAGARNKTQRAMNNALLADLGYYMEYVDMRKNQYVVLKRMQALLHRLDTVPKQAYPIAALLRGIAASFHEYNNAAALLENTEQVRRYFREDVLPQTRDEFEARAVLFQLLNDIEYFLLLKNTFAQSLTQEQKKLFWSDELEKYRCP